MLKVGDRQRDKEAVSESQRECLMLSKNHVPVSGTPGENVIGRL